MKINVSYMYKYLYFANEFLRRDPTHLVPCKWNMKVDVSYNYKYSYLGNEHISLEETPPIWYHVYHNSIEYKQLV